VRILNRKKKLIRNIIALIILLIIFVKGSGLYFTPLGAHRDSERTAHYGPSEIVHIEDFRKGKYILCRYDKWFSCNTVNRTLFFFWRFGNQVHGMENDLSEPLSYSWDGEGNFYKAYGIINDKNINKVELILSNGDRLAQEDFYGDMFLIPWQADGPRSFSGIIAYDKNGDIIYERVYK